MIVAGATGTAIAMGVAGIVAVVAISAVFYAIGRGEDRDRAAAAEGCPDAAEGPVAGASEHPDGERPRLARRPRRRRP